MRYFDRVFATPEEELACDEILLDRCEERSDGEVLRIWQPCCRFVVMGYTNTAAREVDIPACEAGGVSVYRRTTGGGTIVQMPGCYNYAVTLRQERDPALAGIDSTSRYVLGRIAAALSALAGAEITLRGHTDLCLGDRKVAGNAQRRRSRALLFHGTLLLHADIGEIDRLLPFPSAQPDYRKGRSHAEFLANLNLDPAAVSTALRNAWDAYEPFDFPDESLVTTLAREKYGRREWIMRR